MRPSSAAAIGACLAAGLTAAPLSAAAGDAAAGRALFTDRDGGHCILCHRVAGLDAPFQGNVGPELTGVGSRRSASEIRAFIMDPTRFNPEAAMPAYFRSENLRQVAADRRGETLLSAAQIEDLVAFLVTLRDTP